ncbi:AAA family ATPase [Winogradskyella forsetii]|uniref:AAA family ATPase n=1 Tax=Winogradskyella forsetii TaxID=2686077 RepID=UPI0015BF3B34|nr:AAA family ATPase [Winogradskyella forsetii]
MQLKKLYINDYKILNDFTIEFPYDFKKYISVLIGTNGSGKSTILEAIAQIFSSVYLNEKAKFGFQLEYSVRHEKMIEETSTTSELHTTYLSAKLSANKKGDTIQIETFDKDGKTFSKIDILEKDKMAFVAGKTAYSYLPDNIVIYYSGLSEIMQELVKPHNEIISSAYRKNNTLADRDFFYFQPEHFDIILTSLLSFEYGDIPDFLRTKAKINGVQSIQIRLQKPEWAKDTIQNFWGAEGEVRNFLDYLNENSASADDLDNPDKSKEIGNIVIESWQDEAINITIISQQRLFEIRNHLIEEKKLFEILNILFADGMLKDISFSLKKEGEEYKTFGVLSEGEQQAIIIKGLTELLSEKNSLFLFDEPDTYLHPKWQRQFITDIENTIDSSYDSENSFVIATHSPQLLSNAQSELNFVKIIEDGDLIENTPKYYGREINSILYDLMGVEERNKLVRDKISDLYTLIAEEEIEDAESSLKDLQELIGKDDPELKRAEIQISYLKEDE